MTVGEVVAIAIVAVEVSAVEPLVVHNRGNIAVGIRGEVVREMVPTPLGANL